jgi:hypothetical protein
MTGRCLLFVGVGFKGEFFELNEANIYFCHSKNFASFIIFRAILSPFSDSLKTICPRNLLICPI